jgi:HlyD family secretion protein
MKKQIFAIVLFASLLTACGGAATPTALPTLALDGQSSATQSTSHRSGGAATASGMIVPVQQAHMAFTVSGRIKTVNVTEGAQVKAGDVLAELDNAVAQMQVHQAERNLKELTSQAAIAAAERAVADAQQALNDAKKKTDSMFFPRASDTLIENTQGSIDLARQELARAKDAYKRVSNLPDGDNRKAEALVAMTNAQLNLDRLVANYNWYSGTPTEIDAAIARANLDAATAALQEAQWYVSALKGEQVPADATGSKLAQLQQARDDLAAARETFDATRLVAPISGTVVTVSGIAGEIASPAVVFVVISDVSKLQVETTDLSERDVPNVKVGQTVTVTVKALGQDVTGKVVLISPISTTLGGDVVYKTTIDLDTIPDGLRAGMSVDVAFEGN